MTSMMMATTFSRCTPIQTGARLASPTTKHYLRLRPSRVPTTWTTTAGAGVLGTALVRSTRRRPTAPCAGEKSPAGVNTRELSFNVTLSPADDDGDHFRHNLVERMREMLGDPINPNSSGAFVGPIPPQVGTHELMNLTLLAGGASVTLRVRTDNLYVVGFRNGEGMWFELDHYNPDGTRGDPIIQGSTDLAFSGSYDGNGIGDLLANIHDALLGRHAIEGAIKGLSSYDGTYNRDVKLWLRTLIVNFIESVRFNDIADRAASQMTICPSQDIADQRLTEANIELISSFSSLDINNIAAVAPITTTLLSSIEHKAVDYGAIGLTLAEVVGVVIGNINDCDPGKLYGTITVTDGLGSFKLYDRSTSDYQEVGPGGKADLVDAPRPISGANDFLIDVDLMDHYRYFISDRRVALGQVVWNSRNITPGYYNTILKKPLTGEYGKVEVQYVVLTEAVVAKVDVVMVKDGNRFFDANVYGSVTATTTLASGETLEYSLFHKTAKQNSKVRKEESVPLQRKSVSAPLVGLLKISAELWDYNQLETSDDLIVDRSVEFTPRNIGTTDTMELTGPRGTVRVEVTWSNSSRQ